MTRLLLLIKKQSQRFDKELRALEGGKEEGMIKINDVIESDHRDHSAKKKSDKTRCSKRKKCRYFNRGYCKFTKCRYIHPEKLRSIYLEGGNCDQSCPDRHPKVCKWIESVGGCRRDNCAYLHTDERSDRDACRRYKCEGCKTLWDSKNHVVEHDIQNKITFFCLNCEDWIRKKENVFVEGWSLFDNDGYLRHDV